MLGVPPEVVPILPESALERSSASHKPLNPMAFPASHIIRFGHEPNSFHFFLQKKINLDLH